MTPRTRGNGLHGDLREAKEMLENISSLDFLRHLAFAKLRRSEALKLVPSLKLWRHANGDTRLLTFFIKEKSKWPVRPKSTNKKHSKVSTRTGTRGFIDH